VIAAYVKSILLVRQEMEIEDDKPFVCSQNGCGQVSLTVNHYFIPLDFRSRLEFVKVMAFWKKSSLFYNLILLRIYNISIHKISFWFPDSHKICLIVFRNLRMRIT